MFRIKTDIRQYKCETKEKVEKLIRNWVIRPSDLIYDQDENTWEPIGDHPSFVGVFDILAETEANTPDTVVSREPKRPDNPGGEEEVTNISQKPNNEDEDSRATDIFDQEEIAESLAEKDSKKKTNGLAPPEAPEGVEPARHDDEVTMMTDKTFDMMAAEQGDESEVEEDQEDKEDTGVNEKPGSPDDEALDAESDPTIVETKTDEKTDNAIDAPRLGRHDLPEDFFATNEIDTVSRDDVEMRDDLNAANVSETSEVDDEWESMVEDDLRTTNELDPQEIKESIEAKDKEEVTPDSESSETEEDPALRDTDELLRAADAKEKSEAEAESESEEPPKDEFDEEDEDPSLYEPSEPSYIDGYKIPAPFDIGPTMEDQRIGLRRTKVAAVRRMSTYPNPVQKEYKVPELRNFDRTPPTPKDYTLLLVIASWVLLAIMIVFVGMC